MLLIAIILNVKAKKNKGKILLIKEHLDIIRPYSSDITNDHKIQEK